MSFSLTAVSLCQCQEMQMMVAMPTKQSETMKQHPCCKSLNVLDEGVEKQACRAGFGAEHFPVDDRKTSCSQHSPWARQQEQLFGTGLHWSTILQQKTASLLLHPHEAHKASLLKRGTRQQHHEIQHEHFNCAASPKAHLPDFMSQQLRCTMYASATSYPSS